MEDGRGNRGMAEKEEEQDENRVKNTAEEPEVVDKYKEKGRTERQ